MNVENASVDQETAEEEFFRFCKHMKIKAGKGLGEDFENNKKVVVEAIREEKITITEQGDAVFHPEEGEKIIFRRPKAGAFVALGKTGKEDNRQLGMMQSIGEITGNSMARLNQLYEDELMVCLSLRALFLV